MSLDNALNSYTSTLKQIKELRKENPDLFDRLDKLQTQLANAEEDIKEEAQQNQRGAVNEDVKVTYEPVVEKSYDGNTVMEMADEALRQKLIDEEIVSYTVDRREFMKAVDAGDIPVAIQKEAYRTNNRNPRIVIKER